MEQRVGKGMAFTREGPPLMKKGSHKQKKETKNQIRIVIVKSCLIDLKQSMAVGIRERGECFRGRRRLMINSV